MGLVSPDSFRNCLRSVLRKHMEGGSVEDGSVKGGSVEDDSKEDGFDVADIWKCSCGASLCWFLSLDTSIRSTSRLPAGAAACVYPVVSSTAAYLWLFFRCV